MHEFQNAIAYVDVGSGGFGASRGGKLNAVDAVDVRDDETRPTIAYHFQQLIYARTHTRTHATPSHGQVHRLITRRTTML